DARSLPPGHRGEPCRHMRWLLRHACRLGRVAECEADREPWAREFALRLALLPRRRSGDQCRRGGIRALGLEWDGRGGRPGTAGASIGRDRRGTARTPAAAGLRAGRNALRQRNVAWKITCTYSGALIATRKHGYVACRSNLCEPS